MRMGSTYGKNKILTALRTILLIDRLQCFVGLIDLTKVPLGQRGLSEDFRQEGREDCFKVKIIQRAPCKYLRICHSEGEK
jgi:hypothetical protein